MVNVQQRERRIGAMGIALVGAMVLGGCQADYGADVVNATPQPVFVQMFIKGHSESSMAASKRLGPGDRGFIGPVRHNKNQGAYLAFDTLANPGRPATVDLGAGTSFFEVRQDGEGTSGALIVIQK